jgi:hypothetical protein
VTAAGGIITSSEIDTMPAEEGEIQVLGAIETEEAAESPAEAPTSSPEATSGGGLPFTGAELAFVVIAGLVALLAGLTIRRATRAPRPLT